MTSQVGQSWRQQSAAWSLVRPAARLAGAIFPDLTGPERAVCEAFPRGQWVDLREPGDAGTAGCWGPQREIRAEVLRALLLGAGEPEPGFAPAIRLRGAWITGRLDLMGATVRWPLVCEYCAFESGIRFVEAVTRTVRITGSRMPAFNGTRMRLDGILSLWGCTISGVLRLDQAKVTGQVCLRGAEAGLPGGGGDAVAASDLTVEGGIEGAGLVCHGGVSLRGARVSGTVDLSRARIRRPAASALEAGNAEIGGGFHAHGMLVEGATSLDGARIGGTADLSEVTLAGPAGAADVAAVPTEALSARALHAGRLILRPAGPVRGSVDLGHARVGVFQDGGGEWPERLSLDGLTYQVLEPRLPARQRLAWLARDPGGHQPQPYRQLAAFYAGIGEPAQARAVLLARERLRRHSLTPLPRAWGILQDVILGYGYQPWRAAAWLAVLLGAGTVLFTVSPPHALAAGAPPFHAFLYTLDLLLPVVNLGLKHSYSPAGAAQWFSYLLVAAGWVLVSTAAAAAARALARR